MRREQCEKFRKYIQELEKGNNRISDAAIAALAIVWSGSE